MTCRRCRPAVEVAAYRIALEALNNVLRHAAASNCTIRLAFHDQALYVEVTDDGCGITQPPPAGVGLARMREPPPSSVEPFSLLIADDHEHFLAGRRPRLPAQRASRPRSCGPSARSPTARRSSARPSPPG